MRRVLLTALAILCLSSALHGRDKVNQSWQHAVLTAIESFPEHGGYYTGGRPNALFPKTTWQGLHDAYQMTANDERPRFDPMLAQPSFCSSATYAVLIKALLIWDTKHRIQREAWVNMKPRVSITDEFNPEGSGQDDGVGFWGRANANGPGLGVLVRELGAGYSFTAYRGAKSERNKETPDERYLTDAEWCVLDIWQRAVPGDLMKIFWNRNESRGRDSGAIIGCNDDKTADQEAGHSVIFMGCEGDTVTYWSSNGPGEHPELMGYSMGRCHKTAIQRVVFTRITRPERFNNARKMAPTNVNAYLSDLNGKRHSTTAEMLRQLGL
jgi:hypothetical protein